MYSKYIQLHVVTSYSELITDLSVEFCHRGTRYVHLKYLFPKVMLRVKV